MIHSVLKSVLKAVRCLEGLPCIFALLLFLPALSYANATDGVRITHPRNGFYINRYNYDAYLISGTADDGKIVAIYANGILMETVLADTRGRFSVQIDFSNQIEGPVTLLAFQEDHRSIPLTGTYDITPPEITGAEIKAEFIYLTFNELHLKNAGQEGNYRFSPSLNFRTSGGTDDIARVDDLRYRLAMKSVPQHEIITLALSGITDAAGNMAASTPLALNDVDGDNMADIWEAQHGLNPAMADALADADGDGFLNYQEYLAGSHPLAALSAPIEIRDTIPQDDAGIINFARVPDETGFAVLVRSAHGIDTLAPDAVRFSIDDGLHVPYTRDLSSDAVRTVLLNEDPANQATFLWAVYDRFLEPFIPMKYPAGAVIRIEVAVRDIQNNLLQPHPFEFKIETPAQNTASGQNLPQTEDFYIDDPGSGNPYDAGIEIIDGELSGARVVYSSLEPQTPTFGPLDEVEGINLAGIRAAGLPLNLSPHTVFDVPVLLFVPVADDVDIATAGLAYHDGTQWLPAMDADGNLLAGGEGWLVPGSRIDHPETRPALIEVQAYHFSSAQSVIFAGSGDSVEDEKDTRSGSNVTVVANCFINSTAGDVDFGGFAAFIGLIVAVLLIYCLRWRQVITKF